MCRFNNVKHAFILAVAGDVLVGWISSKSGKGGVDDYFLAGDIIKCDDGAESCPDRTKGGTKDIELLNAVSRANYTMLTIRRPVIAQGAFDVGMISHKKSLITIFGHMHFRQKFH